MAKLGEQVRIARILAQLLDRLSPQELAERLRIVDQFAITQNGRHPPAELSLGIQATESRSGLVLRPSPESGQKGRAQAVAVYHRPRNFARLLMGDAKTREPGKTREATLLLRSVPASADQFLDRVRKLGRAVPSSRRADFGTDFIAPLRKVVVPDGDHHHNFQRRELVVWVPFATAIRQVKGEMTALLDKDPIDVGELGSLLSASWFGRPMPSPMTGTPKGIMWRSAPFNPRPRAGGFEGSGERFTFFYVEPVMTPEALQRLLEFNVDILLHLELVHNDLAAQMLIRVRDNEHGRTDYFRDRLEEVCEIVKPITDDDGVVRAHWAFQPGGAHYEGFGHFPVIDAVRFINTLTSTISRPRVDGDIFVGIELGGARYLFELGTGAEGGIQHFLFVGKGSTGKTTLMNLISPQIAGIRILAFNFNPSPLEAFPGIAHDWGPSSPARGIEHYHKEGCLPHGIHFLCTPEGVSPSSREWGVYFTTTRKRDLETVFVEDVVPGARRWIEQLDIPGDFPISVRPLQGCNPALYAAFVSLVWTGIDPWGESQFTGLHNIWADFAGPQDHLVLRLDDVYRLPEYRPADPSDLASRFGHGVRKMTFDATGGAHKENVHVAIGVQALADLKHFPAGTMERFHLAFYTTVEEINGVEVHVTYLFDPDRPEETIAKLIGEIEDEQLFRILTRRKKGS